MEKILFFVKKDVEVEVGGEIINDIQVDFDFFDPEILLEDVSAFYGGVNVFGLRPASPAELVAYENGYKDAVRDLGK